VSAVDAEASSHRSRGTAAAALRTRAFRIIWLGSFASNVGTWMQTVVLPAYIDRRTESGAVVGMFVFAQLGPLLLLSIPGGVLADRFPRKPWIASMQVAAMVLTLALAAMVHAEASVWWLLLVQLVTGVANALNAPAMQGVVPALVDPVDLPGAVSLNSVMINGSRVLGPVIAAALMSNGLGVPAILVINAVTYVFIVAALKMVTFPHIAKATDAQGWANLTTGLRIAASRTVLGRILLAMFMFSFVCLPFVGLFPTIARTNLGLDTDGATYKWLYATWGLGAMLGALAVGTVLARYDKRRLIPPLLIGFAASLAAFAVLRDAGPAFGVGFALGFCYFAMTTSMMTVFQQNLHNSERARVMSLWFMAFGGSVSVGNLLFGPVMDAVGATPVLLLGALGAVGLAWYCDLVRRPVITLADELHGQQAGGDALQTRSATGLDEYGVVGGE
jgi:MFS family permease